MSDSTASFFAGTGIVGGRVFLDSDNDGARDPVAPNANLFDDSMGIISGVGISLYPCGSDLPLASTGVSLTGAYAFSNLVAGEYYVGASHPPEGYGFSEVWSPFGDSETVLQNLIDEDSLLGTTPNNNNALFGGTPNGDVMQAKKLRGTGGVVNGVISVNDPVRNTIHPASGKTICFPLEEGESSMEWGVGLRRSDESGPPSALPSVSTVSNVPTISSSSSPSSVPSSGGSAGGNNKWFVKGNLCKNCDPGENADSRCSYIGQYAVLYEDAAACCEGGLGWSNKDYCRSRSDPETHGLDGAPYTNMWFVDYGAIACVQDCDSSSTSSSCAGLGDGSSVVLYDTALACCRDKLGWVDETECEEAAVVGGGGSGTTQTPSSSPAPIPTENTTSTSTDMAVSPVPLPTPSFTSPTFVPRITPGPTNNSTDDKPTADDVADVLSFVPSNEASSPWAHAADSSLIENGNNNNINGHETLGAEGDSGATGAIIWIACVVLAFFAIVVLVVESLLFRARRRNSLSFFRVNSIA